jgi:hypothetical protein
MSKSPSRMEQLLALLRAFADVVLTGECKLLAPLPTRPVAAAAPRTGCGNSSTLRMRLTRNIQSRVARQLGLSRSHVCLVASGKRRSRAVEAALEVEYAAVEDQIAARSGGAE